MNTPCLISPGAKAALSLLHGGRYAAGAYHSVAISVPRNRELQGLSKGKVRWAGLQTQIIQLWPLEQILLLSSTFILPPSSRKTPSPQFFICMFWRRRTGPRMGMQLRSSPSESISASQPATRKLIRNVHVTQSQCECSWDSCRERQECLHQGGSKSRLPALILTPHSEIPSETHTNQYRGR